MSVAKIDVVERLKSLAADAKAADQINAATALEWAARATKGAIANAEAKENMRDRMAMAALSSAAAWLAVAEPGNWMPGNVVTLAYEMADAMLAARQIQK